MPGKKENEETLRIFVHSFSKQETLTVNDAVCDRERQGDCLQSNICLKCRVCVCIDARACVCA